MSTEAAAIAAEDADRRFVFHPFTQLGQHEQAGSPSMIVAGTARAWRTSTAGATSTGWRASGA